MKITDDVRQYAKEQGYGIEEAVSAGMEQASTPACLLSSLHEEHRSSRI